MVYKRYFIIVLAKSGIYRPYSRESFCKKYKNKHDIKPEDRKKFEK